MPLVDLSLRKAGPGDKPHKLVDGKGLYLLVQTTGGKLWRLNYRFDGKQKTLALGSYPDVSLTKAREKREEARKLLAEGIDPGAAKQEDKRARKIAAASSFEAVAREWFAGRKPTWASSHADKIISRLENDIFPWLGKKPIAEITAPELLVVIRRIEGRGVRETAHRALQNCGQVFRYAVVTGRALRDPTGDLRGALAPAKSKHHASLVEPNQVAELLRAMDAFKGTLVVQSALKLAPLVFARPGELRQMRWSELDLEKAEWRYLVSKTKTDHIVPLATQAVVILKELQALTGTREYVFTGGRDPKRPMSDAAVNAALRRMGYDTKTEITGHGFRAMARTILAEELHIKPEVIEHQLAHKVPDSLGTAYNRTKFLRERRIMMQTWADYLDKLKTGVEVIPLHKSA